MFNFNANGSFKKTFSFLESVKNNRLYSDLAQYGKLGVDALSRATPVDSSLTSKSWGYKIVTEKNGYSIVWYNDHVDSGINVAILIQYGHATRNGGFVLGRDYINPAIRPVFDKILDDVWKKVQNG